MTKCALCGSEYSDQQARIGCKSCPLGSVCARECCPNCGYRNPKEPVWLGLLRRAINGLLQKKKLEGVIPTGSKIISLVMIRPGESTEIANLAAQDDETKRKLLSLGLLPGAQVTLLQRYPCFLLQLGFAQIAIDEKLASLIEVRGTSLLRSSN